MSNKNGVNSNNTLTLLELLKRILTADSRFTTSSGDLLKNKIIECALKLDPDLIKLLLKEDKIKKQFLSDSYPTLKNKVGLANEIDRLLEPKAFTNLKRIDKNGEHPFNGFKRDAEINRQRGIWHE